MIAYFSKGRVALYAILTSAGIGAGDEVIVPGFTCSVVPQAVIYTGARPVYADIEPGNYGLDARKLASRITPSVKAIIVQHTYGIPADMDDILPLVKEHKLLLIEDCCHALGAKYRGVEVGLFGDAAFFSTQWSKPISTGLGGWAQINNDDLAERLGRSLSQFRAPSALDSALLRAQVWAYDRVFKPKWFWGIRDVYRRLGEYGLVLPSSTPRELNGERPKDYEKSMSKWQRTLLFRRRADLDKLIAHRRQVVEDYVSTLSQLNLPTVPVPGHSEPVFLRYPVAVGEKTRFLALARQHSIEIGDWFVSPVHPLESGWERVGYQAQQCTVGEAMAESVVNLPTHLGINAHEVERVKKLLIDFARAA